MHTPNKHFPKIVIEKPFLIDSKPTASIIIMCGCRSKQIETKGKKSIAMGHTIYDKWVIEVNAKRKHVKFEIVNSLHTQKVILGRLKSWVFKTYPKKNKKKVNRIFT